MTESMRRLSRVLGLAAVVVGLGLTGFGVVRALQPSVASPAYVAPSACTGCPAGTSLDSVEVQARNGSTLFVVRGKLPASVDGLKTGLRLVANDVELILQPHGSKNTFEIVKATRGGSAIDGKSFGATIQGGVLLIDVGPPIGTPVSFQVGFWDGKAYAGQLPRSGRLTWSGSGAPTASA